MAYNIIFPDWTFTMELPTDLEDANSRVEATENVVLKYLPQSYQDCETPEATMDLLNRVASMIRALESTLMDFAIWHIEVFDLVQRANWLMEAFRVTVQQIKAGWVDFAEKFQGRISQLEEFESNLK